MTDRDVNDPRPALHYVRISKTASTALIAALEQVTHDIPYRIVVHEHEDSLLDLPPSESFFVTVRDPITRYASGFLSRQRRGRPRYNSAWTAEEEIAFTEFDHPWVLGAALDDADEQRRQRAENAMRSIRHVRTHLLDWFIDESTLREFAPRCVAIIRQEMWHDDVTVLAEALGLETLMPPTDEVGAHRNPPLAQVDSEVFERAQVNLREWFAPDYALLDSALTILRRN